MIGPTIVTAGFYIPYWYIKRNKQYNASNVALILYIFLLIPSLIGYSYQSSDTFPFDKIILAILNTTTAINAIFLTLYLRAHIVNKHEETEIDPELTFLFWVFYLQYKINQIEAETPGALD
jgi:hypothetical protein